MGSVSASGGLRGRGSWDGLSWEGRGGVDFAHNALCGRCVRFELAPWQLPLVAFIVQEHHLGVAPDDPFDRDKKAIGQVVLRLKWY